MPVVDVIHCELNSDTQERGGRVRRIKFVRAEDIKRDDAKHSSAVAVCVCVCVY